MLLINFVRTLIILTGILIVWELGHQDVSNLYLFLTGGLILMVVLTLGDFAEEWLIEKFDKN